MDDIKLKQAILESYSIVDVCKYMGVPAGGSSWKKIKFRIAELGLDISHFCNNGALKLKKYQIAEKICPICDNTFMERIGNPREKTTCSRACANTYFRSGENHGGWKDELELKNGEYRYRRICFKYHEKKCIVCNERLVVAVHHFDGNNKNDNPENLIPLCPTHHVYWHSKYRKLIIKRITKYIENFKRGVA